MVIGDIVRGPGVYSRDRVCQRATSPLLTRHRAFRIAQRIVVTRKLSYQDASVPLLTPCWADSPWTKYETYSADAVIPFLEGRADDRGRQPVRRHRICVRARRASSAFRLALGVESACRAQRRRTGR